MLKHPVIYSQARLQPESANFQKEDLPSGYD